MTSATHRASLPAEPSFCDIRGRTASEHHPPEQPVIEHRADLAGGDLDQEPVTGALPLCKTLAWAKQWVVVEGVVLEHSSLPLPRPGQVFVSRSRAEVD